MDDLIINLTKQMNDKKFLENVKVPILEGHHLVPNPDTLFTAISDEKSIEQFICDGLLDQESFEDHIAGIIKSMEEIMILKQFKNVEDSIHFLEDYPTKDFFFKVYQQDNIIQEKKCIQFLMFFVDKKTNAFYLLSYVTPPYLLSDIESRQEEIVTKSIELIEDLMRRVSY